MKNICILGSTGSIGRNSLEVISRFPDRFRVAYLSTNTNVELLRQQVAIFKPKGVGILDESLGTDFRKNINGSLKVFVGAEGMKELASQPDADTVISAFVGFSGLAPTFEAIRCGKTVALANKETLVVAGELINALAKKTGATIVPIDSEHSAVMQCIEGENRDSIAKLILTASGGPFLNTEKSKFGALTVEDALKHPTWKMGNKITIDSATLMNKGLEVIEAHWLFGLPAERIDIVIHPQSIIHSMVEFVDGSVKAQMGLPDMKMPIQYALSYPERLQTANSRIDFASLGAMTFAAPDRGKFECLDLAYDALHSGGTAPAVMNAANEVAVAMFLQKRIPFDSIPGMIRHALEEVHVRIADTLESVVQADGEARNAVRMKTAESR
ncbi:MAG TPA: 1-deoxy-D-xylulose-5-phosphate reductoisomerase [Bacteroidota bacterium]|nr:1-deoxy-D-xylulose-5-phosphate reductoisomerase [Bacteroidota bacterium]